MIREHMSPDDDRGGLVRSPGEKPARGAGAKAGPKLRPWDARQLIRDLALAEVTRTSLAAKYGVVTSYITKFSRQHAREIDELRGHLDDEFAGMWAASKQARLAAYQHDYEMCLDAPNAAHHEWIGKRTAILRAVADELGQIPGRSAVIIMPVTHVIEGVDITALT